MAIAFGSSAVLATLQTDVAAAWDIPAGNVYLSPPMLPTEEGDLPRAFISLTPGETEAEGLKDVASVHTYRISLMGLISAVVTSGLTLHEYKRQKVNALLAVLTADDTAYLYAGARFHSEGLAWEVDGPENADTAEDIFLTTLVFPVTENYTP